jgi:hypothetical protein
MKDSGGVHERTKSMIEKVVTISHSLEECDKADKVYYQSLTLSGDSK